MSERPSGFVDAGDASRATDGSRADVVTRDTGGIVIDEDAACARQTSSTERAPMNLLVVLDRSGSMQGEKWNGAVAALTTLVNTLSDDTRVGLTLFPAPTNSDNESGYARPYVPIAPLSTTRTLITQALADHGPNGGTPMACAFVGSKSYFDTFTMDGSLNAVLITDGEPTDECSGMTCPIFPPDIACLMNASRISQLRIQSVISGFSNRTPPIRTFVTGTADANNTFLSTLAINGRSQRQPGCETTQSCHYSLNNSNFQQDLNAALDDIRGRAATCEFRISVDTSMVELRLLNVLYTPTTGASPELVPRDVSHQNGWDFSPDMRAMILHGPACDSVLANTTGGSVKILYGCPTLVPG